MAHNYKSFERDDEISVRELIASLKYFWYFCIVFAIIGNRLADSYVENFATPLYVARSVFELPEDQGPSLSGLGAFSTLAGVASSGPNVFDQVEGRDFILELNEVLDFGADPFFNGTTTPITLREQLILRVAGRKRSLPEENDKLLNAVGNFRRFVSISETSNGAFQVIAKHSNSQLSATVANETVRLLLRKHRDQKIESQRDLVSYLSSELRSNQETLDLAISKLQQFSVNNSSAPEEVLLRQSQLLSRLRTRLDELESSLRATNKLNDLISAPSADQALTREFMFEIDVLKEGQLFSRLGRPQTIEAWKAADPNLVEQHIENVTQQIFQTKRNLDLAQERASQAAEKSAELAILQRDVTVATTTFEAMSGQFKQQAIASGIKVSSGTVFETAIPPRGPAEPQKSLIRMMGTVLGLFFGLVCALVAARVSGRVFSQRGILERLSVDASTFRFSKLSKTAASTIANSRQTLRNNPPERVLTDIAYQVSTGAKSVVLLGSSVSQTQWLTRFVATFLSYNKSSVLIYDMYSIVDDPDTTFKNHSANFAVAQLNESISLVRPQSQNAGEDNATKLLEGIDDLAKRFDKVVYVPSDQYYANIVLDSLETSSVTLITVTRPGRTTLGELRRIDWAVQSNDNLQHIAIY